MDSVPNQAIIIQKLWHTSREIKSGRAHNAWITLAHALLLFDVFSTYTSPVSHPARSLRVLTTGCPVFVPLMQNESAAQAAGTRSEDSHTDGAEDALVISISSLSISEEQRVPQADSVRVDRRATRPRGRPVTLAASEDRSGWQVAELLAMLEEKDRLLAETERRREEEVAESERKRKESERRLKKEVAELQRKGKEEVAESERMRKEVAESERKRKESERRLKKEVAELQRKSKEEVAESERKRKESERTQRRLKNEVAESERMRKEAEKRLKAVMDANVESERKWRDAVAVKDAKYGELFREYLHERSRMQEELRKCIEKLAHFKISPKILITSALPRT